jgi:hypothetical protein
MAWRLSRGDRRTMIVAVLTMAAVVIASIGLVRMRNRGRQVTTAVVWAAESLMQVPDSVATTAFPLELFTAARQRFCAQLRGGALPVDSVRAFYQAYTLWARDGVFEPEEVAQLGIFLGLTPVTNEPGFHAR